MAGKGPSIGDILAAADAIITNETAGTTITQLVKGPEGSDSNTGLLTAPSASPIKQTKPAYASSLQNLLIPPSLLTLSCAC